jgi:hypothetical protein
MKAYGGMEVQLQALLTLALDGERSAYALVAFLRKESPVSPGLVPRANPDIVENRNISWL